MLFEFLDFLESIGVAREANGLLTYALSKQDELTRTLGDDFVYFLQRGSLCNRCHSVYECRGPIVAAVELGRVDAVKLLIQDGLNFGLLPRDMESCTCRVPLIEAVIRGSVRIVELLLQKGVDANPVSAYAEDSALIIAMRKGDLNITRLLLEAGADINQQDCFEFQTPLIYAACMGRLDMIKLLIHNQTDKGKLKHDCRRAARCARKQRQHYIAKVLNREAESLTARFGEDETDKAIVSVCDCLFNVFDDDERYEHRCERCRDVYDTQKSWYASRIFIHGARQVFTKGPFMLKRVLTGSESLKEIEELLDSVEADEEPVEKSGL